MDHHFLSFPLILSSLFFMFIILVIRKRPNFNNSPLINHFPGPKKLPFIGNLHQLIGSLPHHRLRDLSNKYGSIMHFQFGEVSKFVISSPEFAKEILKTHDICFAQRPSVVAANIVGYNSRDILFSPYSDYWRQMKKISILELLSPKRVQSFKSIREEEVSNLIDTISSFSGESFNFSKNVFDLTYAITARATFGKKYKEQDEFIELVAKITRVVGGFALADLYPSIKFLHVISGMKVKLYSLRGQVDRITENIIEDHRARRKTGNLSCEGEEDDLVDVLLRIQEKGNLQFPLTTENIKAVILGIFIGGGETSSSIVEWAMSEMLKNPKIMKKAQEEIRRVYGNKGNVDETQLDELAYLKLVIKETLRLHPPVPLRNRECREKCEINGLEIPIKTKFLINAWAMGRDSKYWKEAETFYPERFLESSIDYDYNGNRFEFIPFGAGRRMCPGITFGMADIELPLAKLIYHFDWKLSDGLNPENLDMTESFGATVRRKNDLHLIAIPYHC